MKDEDREYQNDIWNKLKHKFKAECERNKSLIPYISVNGRYEDMGIVHINWWTNGFWSGILWQMYHATNEIIYLETARKVEERLDGAFENEGLLDHDVGFMWLHASVADYRLTKNELAKTRGLHAAELLAKRYNPKGRFISAWNDKDPGLFIVDSLMNLPLLFWASEVTGNSRYKNIAVNHMDTVLKYIVREDGSCNHIVIVDPETGEFKDNPKGQGYTSGSSWSRGQAWGIYGFALSYRYTKDRKYLDAAKRIAHYFLANIALYDYISIIDFRAPVAPVYIDTTACACAACGLLEIAGYLSVNEKSLYVESAYKILAKLDQKYCNYNVDLDGVLTFGSARYDRESDRHVPIIYGDYFYLELILRFLEKDFLIW